MFLIRAETSKLLGPNSCIKRTVEVSLLGNQEPVAKSNCTVTWFSCTQIEFSPLLRDIPGVSETDLTLIP
jgi:hypothetical protein